MASYQKLKSYQNSTIIYDFTIEFCRRYIRPGSRTRDQMEQAARSGKQNIAEGSQASWISKEKEYYLIGVARHSLEELLRDYEDFLRQRGLRQWGKDSKEAMAVRRLVYKTDKTDMSHGTYKSYLASPEQAGNAMICLINQTNLLLDHQLDKLKEELEKNYTTASKQRYQWRIERQQKEQKIADDWLMNQIWVSGRIRLESGKIVKKESEESKTQPWDEEFKKFVGELEQGGR